MKEVIEPKWTSEMIERKYGDTTMQQCGWCEHRGSGSYRYNCMIDGKCSLLKSYDNEVNWNTSCKIKRLGTADVAEIIDSKRRDIEQSKATISRIEKEIYALELLKTDNTPVLPRNRKYDHFNINEGVMVLPLFEGSTKNKWVKGKVVDGYRHHDGAVSIELDEKCHNGEYLNGRGMGAGSEWPLVLLKNEYEYFATHHPSVFKLWLEMAVESMYSNKFDPNMVLIPTPQN